MQIKELTVCGFYLVSNKMLLKPLSLNILEFINKNIHKISLVF